MCVGFEFIGEGLETGKDDIVGEGLSVVETREGLGVGEET
jgi:hypothetical protein